MQAKQIREREQLQYVWLREMCDKNRNQVSTEGDSSDRGNSTPLCQPHNKTSWAPQPFVVSFL